MQRLFGTGKFIEYRSQNINESYEPIHKSYRIDSFGRSVEKTTIFVSHKHSDLEQLKGLIGFLETKYHVKCYIDSWDPSMPASTCGETARQLKNRIQQCQRFILMATDAAIESKWCNWELGYGDSKKYPNNIAIFHMSDELSSNYKGREYYDLYPYIAYYDGTEKYQGSGKSVKPGYYYVIKENGLNAITPLEE